MNGDKQMVIACKRLVGIRRLRCADHRERTAQSHRQNFPHSSKSEA
jgi:hypothetical protein